MDTDLNTLVFQIISFQLLCIERIALKHVYYHCKDPKFGPSFQGGKTARPNKPAQQMQHARGFIVGCANG